MLLFCGLPPMNSSLLQTVVRRATTRRQSYHPALGSCLVRHFVQVYGLDINLSTAPPKELMRLVWSWDGNAADIDSDTCYIMFKDDARVAEWIAAENRESEIE